MDSFVLGRRLIVYITLQRCLLDECCLTESIGLDAADSLLSGCPESIRLATVLPDYAIAHVDPTVTIIPQVSGYYPLWCWSVSVGLIACFLPHCSTATICLR